MWWWFPQRRDRIDPAQAKALLAEVDLPSFPGVTPGKSTVFAAQSCQHCGGLHSRACPRVRRISYQDGGKPAEVEFWPHGAWPAHQVIFLEDVIDAAGEGSGQA